MNKVKELNKLFVKYAAARALLRVKLAEEGAVKGTPISQMYQVNADEEPEWGSSPEYAEGGASYRTTGTHRPPPKPFQLAKGLRLRNNRTGEYVTDPKVLQAWVQKNQQQYNAAVNNVDTQRRLRQVARMDQQRRQAIAAGKQPPYKRQAQAMPTAPVRPTAPSRPIVRRAPAQPMQRRTVQPAPRTTPPAQSNAMRPADRAYLNKWTRQQADRNSWLQWANTNLGGKTAAYNRLLHIIKYLYR